MVTGPQRIGGLFLNRHSNIMDRYVRMLPREHYKID
jgi:hypothetical protein